MPTTLARRKRSYRSFFSASRRASAGCRCLTPPRFTAASTGDGTPVQADCAGGRLPGSVLRLEKRLLRDEDLPLVSTPGRRLYVGYTEIPRVLNGLGIAILSTSKGLKTNKQARTEKLGGELLANVW